MNDHEPDQHAGHVLTGTGPPRPPDTAEHGSGHASHGLRAVPGRARGPGRTVTLLSTGHVALDVLTGSIAVLLPTLQDRFGLTPAGLAVVVAVEVATASLTQPFLGGVADRFGHVRVAAVGLALGAGLLGTLAVLPSLPLLIAALVAGGLASAAFHPAANAAARDSGATTGHSQFAVGLVGAAGMLGVALGPLLVVVLLSVGGPALIPALAVPGLVLAALLGVGSGRVAPHRRAARPDLRDAAVLRSRPILLLVTAGVLSSIVTVTVVNSLPLWLVTERGLAADAPLVGLSLGVLFGGSAVGGVLAVALAGRVGRSAVVVGSLLTAPAPVVLALAADPGSALSLAALALAGLLLQANVPLLILSGQDAAPSRTAVASGLLFGVTTGVAGLAYPLVGVLQGTLGYANTTRLTLLLVLPAAALAWAAIRLLAQTSGGPDADRTGAVPISAACACRLTGPAISGPQPSDDPSTEQEGTT